MSIRSWSKISVKTTLNIFGKHQDRQLELFSSLHHITRTDT